MKTLTTIFTFVFLSLGLVSVTSYAKSAIDTELTAEMMSLVQQHYPQDGAGAAVLVMKGDRVLFEQAAGMAVVEFGVPMRTDMAFHLGSITKQFTAVGLLMLQEAGKLELDHMVKRYIPEYKQAQLSNMTLRHLLTHTAGVPDYDGKNGYSHHGTQADSFETLLGVFNDLPLEFTPGTAVNYSNSGYILLGKVIENVSGISYPEFIKRHIFEPLEMHQSDFFDYYRVWPGLAKGYEVASSKVDTIQHGTAFKPSFLGDGGIVSTLADMKKWYRGLKQNKLINAQSKQLAHSSFQLVDGRDSKQGLGWKIARLGSYKTVEHGGNNHGFENYVLQLPEQEVTVMVLTNLNQSYPGALAEKLASLAVGEGLADKPEIQLSAQQLDAFTGRYQYPDGAIRTIKRNGNYLYSEKGDGVKSKLVPFAGNQFFFESAPVYWLRFESIGNSNQKEMYSESRVSASIKAKMVEG